MNGPGASDDLATMPQSARNEVFFPGFHRNASVTKDKRIAALDDHHVLVVVVHVRGRMGSLAASPKCHLTPIHAVINVTFDTRCGLTTGRDLICSRLHEVRKTFHRLHPTEKALQTKSNDISFWRVILAPSVSPSRAETSGPVL